MLVDIFSSFDDYNFVFLSFYMLIWGCSFLFVLWVGQSFWLSSARHLMGLWGLKSIMFSQVGRVFGGSMGGFCGVLSVLFIMLVILNMTGLIPYVFSPTSHLVVTLGLGFPLWLVMLMSGMAYNLGSVVASLMPGGAPSAIGPFLIVVETVSIMVRPITLSVRLVANMSAGHIVLGLIGVYLSSSLFLSSMLISFVLVMAQVGYFLFEVGVSLIQGYIFSLLLTLYSDEHPAH
uniref:ATP synthase subunit a n=1 Tax=Georissa bangueyensis TaxID=1882664 RepID=A0A1B2G3C4_9GAST|nr:ATP synthase F0 subunit 6 [Georissa bangueyensis]